MTEARRPRLTVALLAVCAAIQPAAGAMATRPVAPQPAAAWRGALGGIALPAEAGTLQAVLAGPSLAPSLDVLIEALEARGVSPGRLSSGKPELAFETIRQAIADVKVQERARFARLKEVIESAETGAEPRAGLAEEMGLHRAVFGPFLDAGTRAERDAAFELAAGRLSKAAREKAMRTVAKATQAWGARRQADVDAPLVEALGRPRKSPSSEASRNRVLLQGWVRVKSERIKDNDRSEEHKGRLMGRRVAFVVRGAGAGLPRIVEGVIVRTEVSYPAKKDGLLDRELRFTVRQDSGKEARVSAGELVEARILLGDLATRAEFRRRYPHWPRVAAKDYGSWSQDLRNRRAAILLKQWNDGEPHQVFEGRIVDIRELYDAGGDLYADSHYVARASDGSELKVFPEDILELRLEDGPLATSEEFRRRYKDWTVVPHYSSPGPEADLRGRRVAVRRKDGNSLQTVILEGVIEDSRIEPEGIGRTDEVRREYVLRLETGSTLILPPFAWQEMRVRPQARVRPSRKY